MLLELILVFVFNTNNIEINEIPVHATINNYAYQITETDYSCTSKAIGDEKIVKINKVCYRIENVPNFHNVNGHWKWLGTKTYHKSLGE
jgi:hypothetical protein